MKAYANTNKKDTKKVREEALFYGEQLLKGIDEEDLYADLLLKKSEMGESSFLKMEKARQIDWKSKDF